MLVALIIAFASQAAITDIILIIAIIIVISTLIVLTLQSWLQWSSLVFPRSHRIDDLMAVSLSTG